MSVRHQVRAYVERLFENLKAKVDAGEYTFYCVYAPHQESLLDEESLELVDIRVNMEDTESIKKFLDRVTRETLENEVKGLKLLGMVLDKDGQYIFSYENPVMKDLENSIAERIEKLKEE